jgi:outer membrane receptor protein involved in Fe transport
MIPVVALARTDVLKDGASAIYGADAMAGVVNLVTRTDYEGLVSASDKALPSAATAPISPRTYFGAFATIVAGSWQQSPTRRPAPSTWPRVRPARSLKRRRAR